MNDPFWNSEMEKNYPTLSKNNVDNCDISTNEDQNSIDHEGFIDLISPSNDDGDVHNGYRNENVEKDGDGSLPSEPFLPGILSNPFENLESAQNKEEKGDFDGFEEDEEETQKLDEDVTEVINEGNHVKSNGREEENRDNSEDDIPTAPKEKFVPGTIYPRRKELAEARIHTPSMAGIWSGGGESFPSIVLSGGYEDDVDDGTEIVYTGQGGMKDGKQVADQELKSGNLVLLQACKENRPVRVTRGSKLPSPYAPHSGYRYDGLYIVKKAWNAKGHAGFLVWRYRLLRMGKQPPLPPPRAVFNKVTKFKYSGKKKSSEKEKVPKIRKRERNGEKKEETPLMKKLRKESRRENKNRDNNNNNNNNYNHSKKAKLKCEFCTRVVEREKMADHLKLHRSKLTKHFEGDKDKLNKRSVINQVRIRGILEGEGSEQSESSESDSGSSSSSGSDSDSESSSSGSSSSDSSDSDSEGEERKDENPMEEELEEPKTPENKLIPMFAQDNSKEELMKPPNEMTIPVPVNQVSFDE